MDDDGAYSNDWWQTSFTCDSDTESILNCQHCINYGNDDELTCETAELKSVFEGEGVTQQTYTGGEEECHNSYDEIWFYCIGGVIPLLIWVLVTMFVLCCCSSNNGNKSNMEASINDQKQTAFV